MMLRLLLNCAMTLVWMLLTQSASFLNGVLGFLVSALVIALASRVIGAAVNGQDARPRPLPTAKINYAVRLFNILRFAVYFIYILIKANLGVAWEIITPGLHMQPRMIRYPVAGLTPVQVTTLANAITLTPGTLSADIDDAAEHLYVHAMYAEHRRDAIDQLDELRDRLLWLVFGIKPGPDNAPPETPPQPQAA